MKRYLSYLSALVTATLVWLIVGAYGFSSQNEEIIWIFYTSPFLVLIYFGCYCLARLGWDLFVFNDFPSEVDALAKVCVILFFIVFLNILQHVVIIYYILYYMLLGYFGCQSLFEEKGLQVKVTVFSFSL